MESQKGPQRGLREKANDLLARLSPSERESLLIKCWMSHDARWFMAVAGEYGIHVANRLNQIAAREVGKVEARRIVRALRLPPVRTLDDYLLAQEVFIALVGPDLLDYEVTKIGENGCEVHVRRCFAYENAARAGIIDSYECGIFARVTGYPEALGLEYAMTPPLGKCLKHQGEECVYHFAFTRAGQRVSRGRDRDHGL
jgi:hypothetical protein